jgi:hypothetical protein
MLEQVICLSHKLVVVVVVVVAMMIIIIQELSLQFVMYYFWLTGHVCRMRLVGYIPHIWYTQGFGRKP